MSQTNAAVTGGGSGGFTDEQDGVAEHALLPDLSNMADGTRKAFSVRSGQSPLTDGVPEPIDDISSQITLPCNQS